MASYWHAPLQLYKIWDVAGLDIDQPPSAQPPRRGLLWENQTSLSQVLQAAQKQPLTPGALSKTLLIFFPQ